MCQETKSPLPTREVVLKCRRVMRSAHNSPLPAWCSHSLTVFHPIRESRLKLLASLARLPAILLRQKLAILSPHRGKRQPCQKSPSTKTATLAFLNTKSGQPGRVLSCRLKVGRAALSREAMYRSGVVLLPLIRDITRFRCSAEMMSVVRMAPFSISRGLRGEFHIIVKPTFLRYSNVGS